MKNTKLGPILYSRAFSLYQAQRFDGQVQAWQLVEDMFGNQYLFFQDLEFFFEALRLRNVDNNCIADRETQSGVCIRACLRYYNNLVTWHCFL